MTPSSIATPGRQQHGFAASPSLQVLRPPSLHSGSEMHHAQDQFCLGSMLLKCIGPALTIMLSQAWYFPLAAWQRCAAFLSQGVGASSAEGTPLAGLGSAEEAASARAGKRAGKQRKGGLSMFLAGGPPLH
jgi:hypothetical protein